MKYFAYLDTKEMSDDTVLAVLDCIAGIYSDNIPCNITPHEINKARKRLPLLGFFFKDDHLVNLSLWSWREHAGVATEGAKLYPCNDIRSLLHVLTTDFKYFRFTYNK